MTATNGTCPHCGALTIEKLANGAIGCSTCFKMWEPPEISEQQERWEKVMHYRRFGVRGWTIECGGKFIAECDFEADADRIIADHQRAGQDDGYWLGEAHLYAEERNRLTGQVEALREALVLAYSLLPPRPDLTYSGNRHRIKAALDATAKGATARCHAGSDGDCSWAECPQLVNYQQWCPLAIRGEGKAGG